MKNGIEELPNSDNIWTRRQFLKSAVVTAGSSLALLFLPHSARAYEATLNQDLSDPTTLFLPIDKYELPIVNTRIGITTDEEVDKMQASQRLDIQTTVSELFRARALAQLVKKDLGEGFAQFEFGSAAADRKNIIITRTSEPSKAIFKRRVLMATGTYVTTAQIETMYGKPEAIAPVPQWYIDHNRNTAQYSEDFTRSIMETQVFAQKGFAFVASKPNPPFPGGVTEIEVFIPTTLEGYRRLSLQGDYSALIPASTPKTVVILSDGLGSSSETQRQRLGPLKEALTPDYKEVIYFSYSDTEAYEPEDTYQNLDIPAAKYRRTVDRVRSSVDAVDSVGYSLGGNVLLRYAGNYIVPPDGPHKDGYARTLMCVSAPLDGISGDFISVWSQMFGINQIGNEATTALTSLVRDAVTRENTRINNINTARFLRNERAVNLITLGNSNDCLVTDESAIIEGFGGSLPLGNGIPNCDSMILALIPPGRPEDKIGHTQMVTDPRGISQIKFNLKQAYS